MGPETLGLEAYSGVTSKFRKLRKENPNCPHKGIDLSCGGKKVEFFAGVFGKVLSRGGKWNTITVQPLDGSALSVQYLHCSDINKVKDGDIVYPWTVLGVTGSVSPDPVPIHMHLQIEVPLDGSEEPCWKQKSNNRSRNFTDPEKYKPMDLLKGYWEFKSNKLKNNGTVREVKRSQVRIDGWKIGSRVKRIEVRELNYLQQNCFLKIKRVWDDAVVHYHTDSGFELSFNPGKVTHSTDCNFPKLSLSADPGILTCSLRTKNSLRIGKGQWKRIKHFSV